MAIKMKKKKTKSKLSTKFLSKTLKLKSNVDPISIVVDQQVRMGPDVTEELQSPIIDQSLSKSPWSNSINRKNEHTLEPVFSNEASTANNLVESIQNNVTNMFASKTMSPQSSTEFVC